MFKLTRTTHLFHIGVLIIALTLLGYGMWHFWSSGPANLENVTMVFEASSNLEKLKNNNDIKNAETQVGKFRTRDAVKTVARLEKDVKKLNYLIGESVESDDLVNSLEGTKSSLDQLIALPSLTSILNVLHTRIDNFEKFVASNNWRTLTRISRRVNAELRPVRMSNPGILNQSKITNLVTAMKRDFGTMENVTTGSVLSDSEKELILARVGTLKTEIRMLEKYLEEMANFRKSFDKLETGYLAWLKKMEPEISLKMIRFENDSRVILFSLGGLFAFLFLSLGFGFLISKKESSERKRRIEKFTIDTIKDTIIPVQARGLNGMGKSFYEEMDKYREYVHKRMSFGTLFRDSIPFSTLILDSNLHVVWANQDFYDAWGIEIDKDRESNLNWDFLSQFTNLGENDPVLTGLKENLSGIYQIQVSGREKKESLPYEMYVSPVEYAGQSRIVIFFYPLRSLEETLSHQMKSVVGPVSRTLESMSGEFFDDGFKEKIQKDFAIAGISELFNKFTDYHLKVTTQKDVLSNEIENLQDELYDHYKFIDDIKIGLGEGLNNFKKGRDSVTDVKNKVVSQVDLRNQMIENYRKTVEVAKNLFREEEQLFENCLKMSEDLGENEAAFGQLVGIKDDFKRLKLEVNDFKSSLLQSLDQSLVIQRMDGTDSKMDQALNQLKTGIKGFDKLLGELNKTSTQLDVSLSKIGMLQERNEKPDLDIAKVRFVDAKESIEDEMFEIGKLNENGTKLDEETVGTLKLFFQDYLILKDSFEKMALVADEAIRSRSNVKELDFDADEELNSRTTSVSAQQTL